MMQSSNSSSLPHDLVLQILLLLPTRSIARFRAVCQSWRLSTSQPSFLLAQSRRAPPAVLFHGGTTAYLRQGRWVCPSEWRLYLFNEDNTASEPIERERRRSIDHAPAPDVSCARPSELFLRCAIDDLLCFECFDELSLNGQCLYVYNLITREWTPVAQARSGSRHIVGMYFHPGCREYRLLMALDGLYLRGFEESTVGSNTSRLIDTSPFKDHLRALKLYESVMVQRCVHWVTESKKFSYGKYYNTEARTKASPILTFDTDLQEFRMIPLPLNHQWEFNRPFDMEGSLGLCQETPNNEMLVWELLKDNRNWVKRAVISTSGLKDVSDLKLRTLAFSIFPLQPLAVWNKDEFLLHYQKYLFIYNFELKTLRAVELKLGSLAMCFAFRESLAFYDAFATESSTMRCHPSCFYSEL